MNKNEYITLCKQKSYELQETHPSLKHSKLLDLAAQELGFKHYTAIVNLPHVSSLKHLDIKCEECGEVVSFVGEGFATCGSCEKVYEPDDLARVIIDKNAAYEAGKEGSDASGSCSNCETFDTVVLTENGKWVCASCFDVFDDLEQCGYCGHLNTGDMEDSYAIGCVICEGMMGKYKDD